MITTFGIFILAVTCQAAKLPSLVNATDYQFISWKKYNSISDINDYMGYLSSIYDFVTVEEIGRSFENRSMKVLKVSNNVILKVFAPNQESMISGV